MKSDRRTIDRLLDSPDGKTRFYLFYGYDDGQSRGHADRLLKAMGADKFAIAAGAVKSDPAALVDEAAAIDMFGGKRALWIEPAGDEIADAVEALLGAAAVESPVIALAGALKKTSRLLKLAESHALALAHVSYELNERDLERMVEELARTEGLRLGNGIAGRIAAGAGGDRGVITRELAKIALYVGAAPERPKDVAGDVMEAIGVGSEGEWAALGDVALAGDTATLADELSRSAAGGEAITLVRALQRRLLMLARLRSRVDSGEGVDAAMASLGKALFFKDKAMVGKMLRQWDSKRLARVAERAGELERSLMRGDSPPPVEALGEELIAIARTAQRR
ncbi:DNA polymerase III subunit delta [Sphingomonas sinipercae]|uniref:DNA-directed DNA polymerase n=1 Tax=Sphingomonas sinipercae TaxID=2714944 RepID=A0A6G7ZKU9_9SPHN|nr:DNA polymerase III subunit delta [Sphingomonas sinipercae]QIL01563.1 DNA polymerase III subunit delta [Sphingomonas sinipercae]